MIVCVCRRVSDREIFDMALSGGDFEDARWELGVASKCGSCEAMARGICARAQASRPGSLPVGSAPPNRLGSSVDARSEPPVGRLDA